MGTISAVDFGFLVGGFWGRRLKIGSDSGRSTNYAGAVRLALWTASLQPLQFGKGPCQIILKSICVLPVPAVVKYIATKH